jgi:hypothetical protein
MTSGPRHPGFNTRTPARHTFAAVDSDVRLLPPEPVSPDAAVGGRVGPSARVTALIPAQIRKHRIVSGIVSRFGPRDGDSVKIWLLSRLAMVAMTWIVAWTGFSATALHPHGLASIWQRWDWLRYLRIAADGYSIGNVRHGSSIAFFPGYPVLLYVVHLFVRSWVFSGLLISLVTGGIACLALGRIIETEALTAFAGDALGSQRARQAARDGLTLFVWAPAAVFMAAGYTEGPFLALTLWGWLAARRGRWLIAGVLVMGAAAIHINGLFVLVSLTVLFIQTRPRGLREWLRGWPLVLPVLPVAGFMAYLHRLTGSWNAWEHAEQVGWDRHFSMPWRTFADTWHYAFGHKLPASTAFEYQLEIVVTLSGIVLACWLARRRRWAEFAYIGLSVGSLACSHVYLSVNRESLTWWPLWALLGIWCVRRTWFRALFLTVSAPLAFAIAYLFLTGRWAG